MKLFSVSARWHIKGHKKDMIQTTLVMAESREEAIEKFKGAVSYPEGARISILEWEDGIFTLSIDRAL